MKKQLYFRACLQCAIIFFSFYSLQAQWQFHESPETGFPRHFAYTSDNIYMIANAGLFVSVDEGNSWNAIPLPDTITTVNQVNESNGSLYLSNKNIDYDPYFFPTAYRSDDSGLTWTSIYPFSLNPFSWGSHFLVKGDTIVISDSEQVAVSVNKGETYTLPEPTSFQIHDIFFHKDKLIVVSWDMLYSSDDLGASWNLIHTLPESFISLSVASIDEKLYKYDEFWSAPDLEGYFYRSDDDGVTWEKIFTFDQPYANQPNITGDAGHLFVYDEQYDDKIFHSTDQGLHWSLISTDPTRFRFQYLKDIFFRLEPREQNGGVWLSHDIGQTFQQYNTGFEAADCNEIISGDGKLWINANAKMYTLETGNTWDELNYYENLVTDDGVHLMAYINNVLKRSYDGGILWYTIPAPLFNRPTHADFGQLFACGNLFFVNVGSAYVSSDFGVTWEALNILDGELMTDVSCDETGYVVSGDSGSVIESLNGSTWGDITHDIGGPGVVSIYMVHRANGYTYANVNEHNEKLSPGSSSWETYTVQNPNPIVFAPKEEVNALAHSGNVLISSVFGHGVFFSLDNAESWQPFNHGLNDFQTRELAVFNDTVYLGVNGGLWSRPLSDIPLLSYRGIVFNDKNENAVKDDNEEGLENIIVSKKASHNSITTEADGTFNLFSQESFPDTIIAKTPSQYAYVSTPPVYVSQPDSNLFIGIHFIPDIYDAAIYITNNTPFRRGFESTITLTYKNNGTETTDLEIKLAIPAELEYLSSSPEATLIADTLTWIIQDVPAFTSGNIKIDVKTDATVPNGTLIILYAFTDVTNDGDANPQDNEAYLSVEVVGSYDPNDKAVFPSGYITPAMIADTQRLEYTIRFQNTGNFPASFVRIQDTLSSHLDLTTLEILSASHPYTWKLLPQNVLDVFFDDINLPDSTNDERGSHGFVKFAINAKTTLQLADQIENKAYIYFDFNVPVVTNTVGSTVGFETGIKEPGKKLTLTASPIPTKDYIMVTVHESVTDGEVILTLYDTKGALVKTKTSVSSENIQLDIRDLPSGVYYLNARIGHDRGTISILKN